MEFQMMKTLCLAAALAAVATTPALAQDQGGFYVGGEVGYAKPKNELTYTPTTGPTLKGSSDKTGFNFGGFAGYGTVLGGNLYLGAEGALSGGGGESSKTFGATKVHLDPKFRYSGAARVGMTLGESGLLYGKVGLERRKLEASVPGSKKTLTQQGMVYGVGYEQKLSETFGLRGELTRVSYGDKTAAFKGGDKLKIDSKETRLSIGGVVHF
jgi:opacity protein-like surface antigen